MLVAIFPLTKAQSVIDGYGNLTKRKSVTAHTINIRGETYVLTTTFGIHVSVMRANLSFFSAR